MQWKSLSEVTLAESYFVCYRKLLVNLQAAHALVGAPVHEWKLIRYGIVSTVLILFAAGPTEAAEKACRFLFDLGADPNARDENGYTALHRSVFTCTFTNHIKIMQILLSPSGDPPEYCVTSCNADANIPSAFVAL